MNTGGYTASFTRLHIHTLADTVYVHFTLWTSKTDGQVPSTHSAIKQTLMYAMKRNEKL